ncbi:MAG: 6-phosphogluconate dehydrogenase [Dehalococcoidia bacterium]|nr:6-phosphogluconate dehydrogenase [Dehalococcoidia bacterium]|tara:strand:+ start:178 stop:1065 length:888 start_codon:yes stop_codon:yes gene_type:complete
MPINTVAILSPGDMGHSVGQLLKQHELRVITCLTGRSARTRALSESAGIEDIPDFNNMVALSDIILSITVSEVVPEVCNQVAAALKANPSSTLFAECNALAPSSVKEMEDVITAAGGRFVDVSIIGSPPRTGISPRFYAAGPHAQEFSSLIDFGLDVRIIGDTTGQASGIKMCYAAMTKGTAALHSQLLMAAESMGLYEPLMGEFESGHSAVIQRMESWIPGVPSKSRRWVSEMQEIKQTFAELGMTPNIFEGVTDMYRLMGSTELADENPESRNLDRTLKQTVERLAQELPNQE